MTLMSRHTIKYGDIMTSFITINGSFGLFAGWLVGEHTTAALFQ